VGEDEVSEPEHAPVDVDVLAFAGIEPVAEPGRARVGGMRS
jgi:hypothetical protein